MSVGAFERLAATISDWARGRPGVRGCLWLGGFARGEVDDRSDLDAALLIDGDLTGATLHAELVAALGVTAGEVRWSAHLEAERRVVIWIGGDMRKIDVVYARAASELDWIADAADVPSPRLVAAWWDSRDASVAALLERARAERDPLDVSTRRGLAEMEVDKFIVAFDACSMLHARSDGFGFYFQYNLALGRLVRLIQLTRVGVQHLYLPRNILSGQLSLPEQLRVRGLAGSLYLPEATKLKGRLADEFLVALSEARAVLGIARDASVLEGLLANIRDRDFFFNLRDVAKFFPQRVVPGRWFRSSALSRWTGTPELHRWMTSHRVTDIIDLRDRAQAAKMPYAAEDVHGRRYHHHPIDGPGSDTPDDAYFARLTENAAQVRAVVNILAGAEGAVVMHCHIGRDRTGWMCALLLSALDLPETAIADDYAASLMAASKDFVTMLLAGVEKRGGAVTFLRSMGVADEDLSALRTRVLAR